MARQGLLAQAKPAATTDTLLYSSSVTESTSALLKIANDGTGAAYRVALRDYDQALVLDASTYKLHKGDVVTNYRINIDTAIAASTFTPGQAFTTGDGEKSFKFESFFIPTLTTIFVKAFAIRDLSLESIAGNFDLGDTVTKGTGGDTTVATVFASSGGFISVGPSTINGSGTEFVDGDTLTSSSGGTGTVSVGGIGTATSKYVFSETTIGANYDRQVSALFSDRTYRFDVSDSTMSGRDFKLSITENGEFGPDGDFTATADNGVEYTTGKTSNGTAGSGGAYVQYDFSANSSLPVEIFWYDGGTGTAGNSSYGGADDTFATTSDVSYDEFYAYDIVGTLVDNTDTFEADSITYTIESQTSGSYGIIRDYTGTALKIILGVGSTEFAGTDIFRDVPKVASINRSDVTVSSVTTAKAAIDTNTYLAVDTALSANTVDNITSLVIGPGQRVHVYSATQNNVFSLIGFEDGSSEFTTRVHGIY